MDRLEACLQRPLRLVFLLGHRSAISRASPLLCPTMPCYNEYKKSSFSKSVISKNAWL